MMEALTTPAYDQVENLVKDIPGWSPIDQLYTLYSILRFTPDLEGDVVEVGSWCGRSAVVLGLAARSLDNVKVHCVDLFPAKEDWTQNEDGSYSFDVRIDGKRLEGYQDQTVWKEPFERDIAPLYQTHESIFEVFAESVTKSGMEDIIIPHKGDSGTFIDSRDSNFSCRMAFLDGDHSYEAVCNDIDRIGRLLVPGGFLCFDDAFSHYSGVNQAIMELVIDSDEYDSCQQMTRKCFVARKTGT